ncbi:netrin receptor unc-5 [Anastrepha ludens]|uniref:netrin receptor unc-5 n=1 Tax=Anastrepha ludens TaxID=28586 RepID=UPI0023B1485D|nr:netrin receptor unc-5 [Anastrepha ludens]XP_053963969.1 netrin receptor unc-5 [Anastrepha ludens]XP_053963970.1 netrin receptor unc-5 [Anastrepha ludens]XP_053963971.1 netrin receptor unc-5 [Anastrepha ludens]XP_053963972.1 netrin receptor unc-5 [Anastrepha ludens]XP_053963973.1 netrin receptor unc-5 [Anastrepha ludens]
MIKLRKCDILIAFLLGFKIVVVANLQHATDLIPEQRNHNLPLTEKFNKYLRNQENGSLNNSEVVLPKSSRVFDSGFDRENVEFSIESDITFQGNERPTHVTEPIHRKEKVVIESTSQAQSEIRAYEDINTTNNNDELPKYENVEYEERSSGTILSKLNTAESGNALPIFLTEPENVYVIKNRPAVLKCKAAHALQLLFKCSGSSQPPPSTHDKHVDPHTGVHVEEVTATIHRDLVDEYFGKGPFKCECQAWSSRGVAKSQAATISIAYIRKHFTTSPTSLKVELGSKAELHCDPPGAFPEPKITWFKNNNPLTVSNDHGIAISIDGTTITFDIVSLQDMANYTCSAENVAGKRISDSAVLIVYVNGGWSSWSPWRECKCSGKLSQGRKRVRFCNNPIPLNGGSLCSGAQVQKSADCISCPEETQIVTADGYDPLSSKKLGRWTPWSEWSSCSSDCIQLRRRRCVFPASDDMSVESIEDSVLSVNIANTNNNGVGGLGFGKIQCSGKDIQTAECRGEHCLIGKDGFDWTLYLGLAFVITVCIAFGAALIYYARRNLSINSHYNMTRTNMNSDYVQGINKKGINVETTNANYDYPSSDHRFMSNDHIISCGVSEHHYDVPNLSANYTNPIDEISAEYVTDTPDTSTADTSNSTYDITGKISIPSVSKNVATEIFNNCGGSLSLYKGEIMLHVPEFAIGKNQKKHMSLILLSDESARISIPCAEPLFVCSTIIYCSPRNYSFQKPVIVKLPHCLVDPRQWNVNIYHADNDHYDINSNWRKIIAVGEETINTPVFVHLEDSHLFIMTEQLGRFAVVAEPKVHNNHQASIKMRLIAFSQLTPSNSNCSLRIYVVKDFPNSKDICTNIETKLGGTIMGESESFDFHLNTCDLVIRVRNTGSSSWDIKEHNDYEQMIPYNHILNNNSILHCEFSIKRSLNSPLIFEVDFEQSGLESSERQVHAFVISNERFPQTDVTTHTFDHQQAIVSIDRDSSYVNETNSLSSVYLPRTCKRLICAALDPPRQDEKDWRLLAKKLGTDHYIAYFATKPSPTEQILNLWECRASNSSRTIVELLIVFSDMDREDIKQIITDTIGPLWV